MHVCSNVYFNRTTMTNVKKDSSAINEIPLTQFQDAMEERTVANTPTTVFEVAPPHQVYLPVQHNIQLYRQFQLYHQSHLLSHHLNPHLHQIQSRINSNCVSIGIEPTTGKKQDVKLFGASNAVIDAKRAPLLK